MKIIPWDFKLENKTVRLLNIPERPGDPHTIDRKVTKFGGYGTPSTFETEEESTLPGVGKYQCTREARNWAIVEILD